MSGVRSAGVLLAPEALEEALFDLKAGCVVPVRALGRGEGAGVGGDAGMRGWSAGAAL